MAVEPETVFNSLGAQYEAAFGNDRDLQQFTEGVAKELPSRSRVLDVGCGTGKPVSHILASAGHEVHGIDLSEEMVKLAGQQVSGDFRVADMTSYEPPAAFDAVFAIRSLFQMPPCDMCSMVMKFSRWIRVGGYLVLGVTPTTALSPRTVTYDPTWDCAWMVDKLWMGNYIDDLFLTEGRWTQLLRESGFVLESEPVSYLFTPSGQEHAPEAHYLMLARKVEPEPLLGPYPLPRCLKPCGFFQPTEDFFGDRLVSSDLERLVDNGTIHGEKVLSIGQHPIHERFQKHDTSQFRTASLSELPSIHGAFDTVIAMWQLDQVLDMEMFIQELTGVSSLRQRKIVIVQGGPYNEAVQLWSSVVRSRPVGHQGHLLHSAMDQLAKCGFGDITLQPIDAHYEFREDDLSKRCVAAAEFLARIWGGKPSQTGRIHEALIERLQLLFRANAHAVSHRMVAIVARPGLKSIMNGRRGEVGTPGGCMKLRA
ncbi:hypothetical protein FE257_010364 [Aspergillus nanangensis]|uniref:Methyltransferase domain-containing protein n=1 Tax=Aspergillus nanangensis TaxID=2582783 RepID=A0AAD4CIU0_ASPNN|nr:hypothetical protein FE257_010364 [Aspergillus nanangensis]